MFAKLSAAIVLLAASVVPAGAPDGLAPAPRHEPSGLIDLAARTLQRTAAGAKTRVQIELSILSRVDLAAARVSGSLHGGPKFDEAFGIPDEILALRASETRKIRFTVELERGRLHHLLFTVAPETPLVTVPRVTTSIRVNLDSKLDPVERDGLLQYRALMRGGEAPP